ncbi:3-hydroxyacyl-CoA dehydrogenase [Alcaligenaceae bacterium 429]|nr:3-hydroxyacyl-CoA dehydrogenase [Alcaligenaceae bacterium 429]
MKKVAVIGGGIIGSSWAVVFARAGIQTSVYDHDVNSVERIKSVIRESVENSNSLLTQGDSVDAVMSRITIHTSLAEALCDADYIQEAASENLALKQQLFADMAAQAKNTAILASSTSTYGASLFTRDLAQRERCLVVHPMTPPHLMPIVEVVGAEWTSPEVIKTACTFMQQLRQRPVVLEKEVSGFVLNRLQGALLMEMFELIADGVIRPADADLIISQGLGLRWSVVGPLEGIDLNAPTGIQGYLERYGHIFNEMAEAKGLRPPVDTPLIQTLHHAMRASLGLESLDAKRAWRDQAMAAVQLQLREIEERA